MISLYLLVPVSLCLYMLIYSGLLYSFCVCLYLCLVFFASSDALSEYQCVFECRVFFIFLLSRSLYFLIVLICSPVPLYSLCLCLQYANKCLMFLIPYSAELCMCLGLFNIPVRFLCTFFCLDLTLCYLSVPQADISFQLNILAFMCLLLSVPISLNIVLSLCTYL